MRSWLICVCVSLLTYIAPAQQAPASPNSGAPTQAKPHENAPADNDSAPKSMFEAKIKAEWEAIKGKDKKAYGEMLAEDYEGVEVDGRGERSKLQAANELAETNVSDYTLWGLKVTSLGPDAAFVIYEVTMQFPPRSQVRFSRVYIGEVWVKRDGQWKLLHYQETHVK